MLKVKQINLKPIPLFILLATLFIEVAIPQSLHWAMSIGGSYHDSGQSLVTDSESNVLITGYFHGMADFDPSDTTTALLVS